MKLVKAINCWACALACIEATLNKHGNLLTQKDIIKAYSPFFHAWRNDQEGLLTRAEIPYLLELLGYHFSIILFTNDKDEFLNIFTKYVGLNRYWGSFLLLRQPTNHCNAIRGLNGQQVEAMEPDQNNPIIVPKAFVDLHQNNAPEYLLLCS